MGGAARPTDPALWCSIPVFGVAGGPNKIVLSTEEEARAFSVGAQVRQGPAAEALAALFAIGGEGLLSKLDGAKLRRTELGRFDQVAWGHLRALGYVESVDRDGVRLTTAGRAAASDGRAEQARLLERCKTAAAATPTTPASGTPGTGGNDE